MSRYLLQISYYNRPGEHPVQIALNGEIIRASTLKGALKRVTERIVRQENDDRDVASD